MATEWTHNMKLFNNELPNLEILRLDQYPLQWDLICASTKLRELTLVNLAPGSRLVPDAISFLSLLQSLTIEEHDRRRFTPLVISGSNDASHPFHLPYLQHVSFRGHTNWVLPFLESLTASSLTCLLISCKRAVNEQLPRLRQAIHTLLTGGTTSLAQTPFQYLRAEYCGISALKCSADLSNDHQGCSCLGPTFQLLIKDPSPDLSANIGKLLILPLIRNLNRRYITQLNWTVEDSRMGDRFFDLDKDYFHSMDHLEELSIGTSLANGFDGLFPIKVPHASEPTSTNAETRHAATPDAGVLQSGFTQGSVTLASPSISPSVLSAIFDNNSLPLPRNSSKPRQKAIPTLASIGKVFGIGTSGIYHQPANTAHPSVIVPCPALRRILIYNEAPYLHPSTDARLNLAESLIDLLQKRGGAGRRLELLDLTKCLYGVEKKHAAKMGELVDQLICRP
ncbi:hypothetical protein AX16_001105 [Volvariella volvacea WC 439]|nr:hypothetical protein AX16_001105 [Volvariella volvacea WC 439]